MSSTSTVLTPTSEKPGLLVSVRDANEALTALAGGVEVIDVKEPSRGPLGAADLTTIADVVRAVADRAPVSAAAGELRDWPADVWPDVLPDGVALVKFGLAGCAKTNDWPARWRKALAALAGGAQPVAVVYADWQAAAAPEPRQVLAEAVALDCPALLVDTWNKSSGTLLDHWPADELQTFVDEVRDRRIAPVLAGSLSGDAILSATRLQPRLIAIRGAACVGGRTGAVSLPCIRTVQAILAMAGAADSSRPAEICSRATDD